MKYRIYKWVCSFILILIVLISLACFVGLLSGCGLLRGIRQFDGKNETPALAGPPLPPLPSNIKTGAKSLPRSLVTLAITQQGESEVSMEAWADSMAGYGKVCRVTEDGGLVIDEQMLAQLDMINMIASNPPVVLALTNQNDIIDTNLWIMTSNQAQAFKALDTKLRREKNPALVSQ
jgi:hypothetical protein